MLGHSAHHGRQCDERHRHSEEHRARADRRQTLDLLQVQGREERHTRERSVAHECGDARGRAPPVGEERAVDERLRCPDFFDDEPAQCSERNHAGADDRTRAPPRLRSLQHREDRQSESRRERYRRGDAQGLLRSGCGIILCRAEPPPDEQRDGHVDQEERAPDRHRFDQPGHQRAGTRSDGTDSRPDPDDSAAVARRCRRVHQRESGGRQHRRAETLHHPPDDEHLDRPSKSGDERAGAEDHDSDPSQAHRTKSIRGASGRDQRRGERQQVPVHHPRQIRCGQVEITPDRIQQHRRAEEVQGHDHVDRTQDDDDRSERAALGRCHPNKPSASAAAS